MSISPLRNGSLSSPSIVSGLVADITDRWHEIVLVNAKYAVERSYTSLP